jgi:hypothetical protein
MRMKKKKKTKKARAERARLYIVKKSKTNRSIDIVEKNTNAAQQINQIWTLVTIKKRNIKRADLSSIKERVDKIYTMISMISRVSMSSFSNVVRDVAESRSWAKTKIMKFTNREKAMKKRSVNRSRFVSKASSVSSVMNDIVHDSDIEIWETQHHSQFCSITFEMIEWVLWFRCWLITTHKIMIL